jgi:hypothetical protein
MPPANSVKPILNEGSKTVLCLDPGAEYMSKIARGEEKNAKAVASSQFPVLSETPDGPKVFLRTGSWQLATGNCL